MNREKLYQHLEQHYVSKREMISRLPLDVQPDEIWQDPANLIHLKFAGFQELRFIVRDGNRLKLHAFFQDGHSITVGRAAVCTVPAFPERLWIFYGVRVCQNTGRPCSVGEELTAVFLGSNTKADGVFLQGDGTVAHDAVESQSGDMEHVLRRQHHLITIAGHVGVGQNAFFIPVDRHLIRQQRIQACDLVPSGTDDLAVAVAPQEQVC